MKKSLLAVLTLSANLFLISCADEQARSQIADLNNRLSQIQDSLTSVNSKVASQKSLDTVNKMNDLQDQIDQINGNVSTIGSNQKKFQDTQNQVNQSVQQQIASLNGSSSNGAKVVASSAYKKQSSNKHQASIGANDASAPAVSVDNGDERQKLKDAFNKIKAHNFKPAISQLKDLIANSNSSLTVDTATYYLAVAYAASGQYKNSIDSAKTYLENNPNGKDAANAMRTIYISQSQLGMQKSAMKTAHELIKKFPDSESAKKVKSQISQ